MLQSMGLCGVRCDFTTKQRQTSQNVLGVRDSDAGRKRSLEHGTKEGLKGTQEKQYPVWGWGVRSFWKAEP